jgi:hypothetical protein
MNYKEVALMKRIVLLVAMLAMVAFWAAPALAQGQVEQGTDHANSICSFSGLNDVPEDPVEGGRVQSYGQGVSQGALDPTDKETVERPGVLCNAHLFPYPEGFEGEE